MNFRKLIAAVLFGSLVLVTGANNCLSAEVELPGTVEVEAEPLTLGKIAEGKLDPQLASIELGSLPNPGKSRILSRTFIKMKAISQGVSLSSFKGDVKRTKVIRPNRRLTEKELRTDVRKKLTEKRALGQYGRVEIKNLPDQVTVAPGEYELKLRPSNPYSDHRGIQDYRFGIVQNGKEITSFKAKVSISMNRRVAVAVKKLSRGESLGSSKIEWKKRDVGTFSGIPITPDRDLDQYIMARTLRAGRILGEEHLERPVVVERRDRVTLRFERNGITLTTKGEAQEDGAIGDQIKVENLSSEQEVTGNVKQAGLVVVNS